LLIWDDSIETSPRGRRVSCRRSEEHPSILDPTFHGQLADVAVTRDFTSEPGLYPWCAVIFGLIGFVAYRYGKRAGRPRSRWLGVALMLYPYAIAQTWLLYVVGAALCVGVLIDHD